MILTQKIENISNEDLELILNSESDFYIKVHNGPIITTNDIDERDYYVEKHILDYAICTSDTDFLEEIEKRNITKNYNEINFDLN